MKYLDHYRNPRAAEGLLARIRETVTRPWIIMDACGGAHHLLRFGIDRALPPELHLVHGPGCPICAMTPSALDLAVVLAGMPSVTFCTSGDLLRVPGPRGSLQEVKAQGGDVRSVYSPLDALALAKKSPDRHVVFFAVGFETTAPTAAAAIREADRLGLANFQLLSAQLRMVPTLMATLAAASRRAQAVLAAGHVGTVIGSRAFEPITTEFQVPVIITGTDPVDLVEGLLHAVEQLEQGDSKVENQYSRAVRPDGNLHGRSLIDSVFEPVDLAWTEHGGKGSDCGLAIRPAYARFDAALALESVASRNAHLAVPFEEPAATRSTCVDVVTGRLRPTDCAAFGARCSPDRPLGAPMASPEGACAAYHCYRRLEPSTPVLDRADLTVATPQFVPRGA